MSPEVGLRWLLEWLFRSDANSKDLVRRIGPQPTVGKGLARTGQTGLVPARGTPGKHRSGDVFNETGEARPGEVSVRV